jgi:polyisoprenoid-binding protein YceI/mono/diheme cytochrome c family protein
MRHVLQVIRRHPWRTASVAVLVVIAAGAVLNRDLIRLALTPDVPIDRTLPVAAALTPADGEVVYRIDASRSELTVGVDEVLAGADRRVELTTRAIAGDIAVAPEPAVRVGEVVVDAQQLESDNSLRDKALHHDFLESHTNPEVLLRDVSVTLPDGASSTAVDGATLEGELVVKGVAHPTSWDVDAEIEGDTLTATATTTVKMSDIGVGPINKVGLVRTSDDVDLELRLVAVDGTRFTPPVGLVVDDVDTLAASKEGAPSFVSDVQPILEQNCASCHQVGSIGAMMWTLETAGDAADVADGLAVVTEAGYMPPWPASDLGVPLQHSRGLSDEQVTTIVDWAAAGAPLDVERTAEVRPPVEPEVRAPRPDRVVTMAEPYVGDPEQRDDYRCFILDPQVTEPSFLTAYTFDPDQLEVVHHAIVYRVRAEDRPRADEQDAADEGPGWSCLAGMGDNSGARIAGWVPGQRPAVFPEGDGFEFGPGDILVAQIHYHVEEGSPADQSGMTLEFEPASAGITALQSRTLIGPVEIPCPEGATGALCNRDAAVADVAERFGPASSAIPNVLNRTCGTTPEEVAAASDGVTGSTTCNFAIRQSGEIVSMLAHMHELGASYRMTLNPETEREQVLLDIPVWNFSWQLAYAPVTDVRVDPGDSIRVTCTWDRRLRFDPDPRYIVFAEGTEDEMCFSTLTIRPVDEPDPAVEVEAG